MVAKPNAQLTAWFLPNLTLGGAELTALELAEEAVRQGLRAELVVGQRRGDLGDRLPPGVGFVDLGVSRTAVALPRLRAYLERRRPWRTVSVVTHANVIAAVAAKSCGANGSLVIGEHVILDELQRSGSCRDRMLGAFVERTYPWARSVVAVSEAVRAALSRRIGARKCTLAPNPIRVASIRARASGVPEHPWCATTRRFTLICAVGRLAPEKRYDLLLRGVAAANRLTGGGVRLMVAGEGPLRANLEALVRKLGLSESVDFCGYVRDPIPLMAACDVCVNTSSYEAQPRTLLEALVVGVPILASPTCADTVAGFDGCVIADPRDVEGLGRTLVALRRRGERYVRTLPATYAPERVLEEYLR